MCPVQKTSVSGLGMKTGGLIFSVRSLNSHSSITYCTGILDQSKKRGAVKKYTWKHACEGGATKLYTWTDVWCRAAISALSYLVQEAPITYRVRHFQSVDMRNNATEKVDFTTVPGQC